MRGRMHRAIAVAVLSVVVLTSMALCGTIQYDDSDWEYQSPVLGGLAVRFTVPAGYGPLWGLNTLTFMTDDPYEMVPVTIKVWADEEGQMGSVLFELPTTFTGEDPNWHDWGWYSFDLSGAGLTFRPGESFFAGYDQNETRAGCFDTSSPDGRTYFRYSWDSTWTFSNDDALIHVSGDTVAPEPISLVFFGTGLAAVCGFALRGKRRSV